ncbi:AraC family transcriptional regulator [Streptomyces sp. NBC_00083]|uniref:helix-turn-helix domain-containing protein n=1 Tax=Streptomyces sp. NBC_00083 TaxID=2975647 RepID=UPI002258F249|nr:AraC family transcriptional regulator [Streptomyces sp. NBC_00083]MCX5384752.1 AraC family transcriptional regulator [Streptomyces sp. NBC_00083]
MELSQACEAAGIGVVAVSEHTGPPRLHRALPVLSCRLVLSLGTPIDVCYGDQARRAQAVVTGLMRPGTGTPSLTLRPGQPTVYVELSPTATQRLTGVPLSELDAGGLDAIALLPWLGLLSEELAELPADQRVRLMRRRLLDHLVRARRPDVSPYAVQALGVIRVGHGRVPVEDVARQLHLSPRRLRQVLGSTVGITPKFASRVARLTATVRRAGNGADSWAEIAAECAYHDQSHLVRDFQDLMGTTPTAWLAEEGRNLQGGARGSSRPSNHDQ